MSDPYKRDRRLGRWYVSGREMFAYPGRLEEIQRHVVILDIRRDWASDRVEFTGRCEQFGIVPEGEEVPLYRPHVLAGEVRWEAERPSVVCPPGYAPMAAIDWQPGMPIRLVETRQAQGLGVWPALASVWRRLVALRMEAGR